VAGIIATLQHRQHESGHLRTCSNSAAIALAGPPHRRAIGLLAGTKANIAADCTHHRRQKRAVQVCLTADPAPAPRIFAAFGNVATEIRPAPRPASTLALHATDARRGPRKSA
jgi:hypothetical protein